MDTKNLMRFVLVALFFWVGLASVLASDWPQFKRDSARTGDAPDETLTFPMKRILAVKFGAPIYASPAAVGGKVYVQDARGNMARIDVAARKADWVRRLGGINNISSPAVAQGRVYVGNTNGSFFVLDAGTGKTVKKIDAKGSVRTAPALGKDCVYFSNMKGDLVKIDYDGNEIWRYPGKSECHVEFAVREGKILFFTGPLHRMSRVPTTQKNDDRSTILYPGHLFMLEDQGTKVVEVITARSPYGLYAPEERKKLPRLNLRKDCWYPPVGGPVFGAGNVMAYQNRFRTSVNLFIQKMVSPAADELLAKIKAMSSKKKGRKAKGAVKPRANSSRLTPSTRGDLFFGIKGSICCLSGDGTMKWQWGAFRPSYPDHFQSSPALSKEHVLLGSEKGGLYAFNIEPDDPANPFAQAPVSVYQLSHEDGAPNTAISSSPAISNGKVFFGGEDGVLYGLGQGTETAEAAMLPDIKGRKNNWPGRKLKGTEWVTCGGDMGWSHVSEDKIVEPPLKLKWMTKIKGTSCGPCVVAGGKIFSASEEGSLTALDAETGEILWDAFQPHAYSRLSPTYAEGKLLSVLLGVNGGIYCHDAETGRRLWRRQMAIALNMPRSKLPVDGLPAHNGKVFVCRRASGAPKSMSVTAYSLESGEEFWSKSFPAGSFINAVSQGVLGDGNLIWGVATRVAALNPDNGEVVWSKEIQGEGALRELAYRNGTLVLFRGLKTHSAYAYDGKTGKALWVSHAGNTYTTPLTDAFLNDQGKNPIGPGVGMYQRHHLRCWVNGTLFSNHWVQYYKFRISGYPDGGGKPWTRVFPSHCYPAPSPAYGRLYYSTLIRVVHCFENDRKTEVAETE